jgi:hypothetical protein
MQQHILSAATDTRFEALPLGGVFTNSSFQLAPVLGFLCAAAGHYFNKWARRKDFSDLVCTMEQAPTDESQSFDS